MTTTLDDPLRAARRAVHAGRFRDAWDDLARQPETVRHSPEWDLLAAMTRWRLGEFRPSLAAALQARDGSRARGDVDGEMRAENVAAAGGFALGPPAAAPRGFPPPRQLPPGPAAQLTIAPCAHHLRKFAFFLVDRARPPGDYRLAGARVAPVGPPPPPAPEAPPPPGVGGSDGPPRPR